MECGDLKKRLIKERLAEWLGRFLLLNASMRLYTMVILRISYPKETSHVLNELVVNCCSKILHICAPFHQNASAASALYAKSLPRISSVFT